MERGNTWYILPLGEKLIVVNNRWRKAYNQDPAIKRSGRVITFMDLEKMAIYKRGK